MNDHYPVAQKKQLAAKISASYAEMMQVDIRRISVDGVWRISDVGSEPTPVSMLMLDIRRGRPAELRMEVAKALCAHCIEILGLREDRLNMEFT